MSGVQCILCKSTNVSKTASINTNQLADLYKKRAGVDVKRFFKEDHISLMSCNSCSLKFFWPLISGDEKFYDELQDYPGYYLKDKNEYREAAKHINETDDVLEIGCGEGLFADFIRCRTYTGLEFSNRTIKKAREKKLDILHQSIEEHSLGKQKYDVVCFFQVLEHISDPNAFIKNSIHCLKDKGKLIIAVPSEDSFISNATNFYLNMPPHHISRWNDVTLAKTAELFDLKMCELIHESLHPVHKKFYLKTAIHHKITRTLGIRSSPVDTGLDKTLLYAISSMIAIGFAPFITNLEGTRGQSVLAIYSK